jgi:hypothetical protein
VLVLVLVFWELWGFRVLVGWSCSLPSFLVSLWHLLLHLLLLLRCGLNWLLVVVEWGAAVPLYGT